MTQQISSLGRTLVIANPASHSGHGAEATDFVRNFLRSFQSLTNGYEVTETAGPEDATRIAADSTGYDTVLALGGDGVIHEVVNGLMQIPRGMRPRMGILPLGSGNDFARTLGMPMNDAQAALAAIAQGKEKYIELGRVNDTYFMQTLSFGLDAAIALDTVDRRANDTRQEGAGLFATSGLRIFTTGLRGWHFVATIDGEKVEGTDMVFAIQNGPTYGGGFRICPKAVPTDGMLDLCYTLRKPSVPHTLALFGLARGGWHARSNVLKLQQIRHLEVEFPDDPEDQPPCQVDGERLEANRYVVDVVPQALRVIVPSSCGW